MTTYKDSGVDIDTADATKKEIAGHIQTGDKRVLNKLGAFASLFKADFPDIKNPVLVLKTEEPGSKQLLAAQYNRLPNIAYDLINHLINDIVVMGATPLAVLDTIICGKLEKKIVSDLVKNMSIACQNQGCSLVGGETSEQPGVIPKGEYILSAAAVGVVDQDKIIDGSKIQKGDIIIGVHSNGLHTNGYSLVRKLLDENIDLRQDNTFIDAILKPHMCYYSLIKNLDLTLVNGMAHITGGGINDNLNRILPNNLHYAIDYSKINIPYLFKTIQNAGVVPIKDMWRTFNMGIGLIIITSDSNSSLIFPKIWHQGYSAKIIGEIVRC